MEYYWAMKRDGVLTLATRRMTLEDILLSERSQTPKVTLLFLLSEMPGIGKSTETESRLAVVRARGREDGA